MRRVDLAGRRFGRWTVEELGKLVGGRRYWLCACDCGVRKQVKGDHLNSGASTSCGCWKKDRASAQTIHGGNRRGARTPEYASWAAMVARCTNEKDRLFKYYGARGIKVCARWRNSFQAFLEDLGQRPEGMTLERVDNDGDYEPGNVKWATRTEQARNKRSSRRISWRGTTRVLVEWAEVLGIPYKTLHSRLNKYGWSVDRAFSTPYGSRS